MAKSAPKAIDVVIVEDQVEAAEHLAEILLAQSIIPVNKIKQFRSIVAAECYLEEKQIDLLFLDLDLNGANGFEILNNLSEYSLRTIIVSGHVEQALRAFEYGVLDFVPKPATPQRLARSLRLYGQNHLRFVSEPQLKVTSGETLKNIPLSDIIYFEAEGDYSKVKTITDDFFTVKKGISQLERQLPGEFFRTHKSFMVNLNRIDDLQSSRGGKYATLMNNGESITVSRQRFGELKNRLLILSD